MLPVVALVGRPNVGKSTLFNALTRSRDALVADLEGLTRDRRYGVVEAEQGQFIVVDTGGLQASAEGIAALTARQVRMAIEQCDLALLVVDVRAGLNSDDMRIATELRTSGKAVMVVANKIDGLDEAMVLGDCYSLGFEAVLATAATHRRGIQNLLEQICTSLADSHLLGQDYLEPEGIKVAVVGRPNVGKSTLINRLVGQERLLAYDAPGTTRDTVYVPWERDGQAYVLIDTAGIRRRAKVDEGVEKLSVIKAMQAIQASDVTVLMIDASEGVVDQDSTILGQILDSGRALVIAVNKWDGLPADQRRSVKASLERKLTFVAYARRITISALKGSGIGALMAAIQEAYQCANFEASSATLTDILNQAYQAHPPPMVAGRTAKLRYAHLGGHKPLCIVIHGTRTATLPASYQRYLRNTFRQRLNLVGAPVRLELKSGDNPYQGRKNPLTPRQVRKRKRLIRHIKKRK